MGTLAGVREDLKPAVQETQSTVKDLRDSWDDLCWDVKASVESATVAARGVAEASEAAGKAAPKFADAAVRNGDNIAGITADVHTATSAFVKPKATWQKIKSALWLTGKSHAYTRRPPRKSSGVAVANDSSYKDLLRHRCHQYSIPLWRSFIRGLWIPGGNGMKLPSLGYSAPGTPNAPRRQLRSGPPICEEAILESPTLPTFIHLTPMPVRMAA
jgi:hypothetical protein